MGGRIDRIEAGEGDHILLHHQEHVGVRARLEIVVSGAVKSGIPDIAGARLENIVGAHQRIADGDPSGRAGRVVELLVVFVAGSRTPVCREPDAVVLLLAEVSQDLQGESEFLGAPSHSGKLRILGHRRHRICGTGVDKQVGGAGIKHILQRSAELVLLVVEYVEAEVSAGGSGRIEAQTAHYRDSRSHPVILDRGAGALEAVEVLQSKTETGMLPQTYCHRRGKADVIPEGLGPRVNLLRTYQGLVAGLEAESGPAVPEKRARRPETHVVGLLLPVGDGIVRHEIRLVIRRLVQTRVVLDSALADIVIREISIQGHAASFSDSVDGDPDVVFPLA